MNYQSLSKCFTRSAMLLIVSLAAVSQAEAGGVFVSGTISRPVATPEPLSFTVYVCNSEDYNCGSQYVTILANETSVSYSTEPSDLSSPAIVRYYCDNCESPSIEGRGYYALGETGNSTFFSDNKTLVDNSVDGISGIDFNLVSGTAISGTVNLPSALNHSANFSLSMCTGNSSNQECYYKSGAFEALDLSQPFTIDVPMSDDDYELKIDCYGCNPEFYSDAYYAAGLSNSTTAVRDRATLINGLQPTAGLSLTVIEGVVLSGSISLPASAGTATSVLYGNAKTCDSSNDRCFYNSFNIAVNSSSASYDVRVAPELDWTLEFECYRCDPEQIFRKVFYASGSPANSAWAKQQATPVSFNEDTSGLDVTLFTGTVFYGVVHAPDAGPSQPFRYQIFAYDAITRLAVVSNHNYFAANITAQGYSLEVPLLGDVLVGFIPDVASSNDVSQSYLPYAFHSMTGKHTAGFTERAGAVLVSTIEGVKNGIDLTLSTGNLISGSIQTPDNEEPSRDLLIHMIGDQNTGSGVNLTGFLDMLGYGGLGGYGGTRGSGGYLYGPSNAGLVNYDPIRISADSGGAGSYRPFSFRISPNTNTSWRTYYGCLTCGSEFEKFGYFGDDPSISAPDKLESFASSSKATRVDGGSDYSDHDLFLVKQEAFCVPIVAANGKVIAACF